MAAKNMGIAVGVVAAVLLVALVSPAQAQTLKDSKNQGRCNTLFNTTLNTLYKNDTACADLIYKAFDTNVKSQCPPTDVGSPVHLCLNKNGSLAYTSAWASVISGCEYMYIANRQGAGESETGFTYSDNSCFQAFDSWAAFSSYLNDASKYGGKTGSDQAAGMTQMAMWTLLGAVALALMVMLH